MSQKNTKTPAMVLQELTVKHGIAAPEYNLKEWKSGTHDNEFHYEVNVADIEAFGFGRSKQVAKHDAATKALEILAIKGVYDASANPMQEFNAQSHRNESDSPLKPPINYIGTLKDLCFDHKLPSPLFGEISDVGPPHCREFTYDCRMGSMTTQATANTKKQAKQLAARDMLCKVRDICPQLAEQAEAEANALTERDDEVIEKYTEADANLGVTPNKSVLVADFPLTLRKIMDEKKLQFEAFEELFKNRTFINLQMLCALLELEFKVSILQNKPTLAVVLFGLETPLAVVGMGPDEDVAKENAVQDLFVILEVFMRTPRNRAEN